MNKKIAAFGFFIALAGCSSDPTPPPVTLDQDASPRIALDVKKISLADRSGFMPSGSPYKTNEFTPTIADAVRQWAKDHLQANGESGQAIVLIKKASLLAQPMPLKDGVDTWFTRQQSLKYIARAEVSIEANGRAGFAVAEASASRAATLPEDPTPLEKRDAYNTLLNGLMKDLQENLESSVHAHMAGFIATPPAYGAAEGQGVTPTVDQSAPLQEVAPAAAAPVSSLGASKK